jgi:hypothetical protein
MYSVFEFEGVRFYTKTVDELKRERRERMIDFMSRATSRSGQIVSVAVALGVIAPAATLFA